MFCDCCSHKYGFIFAASYTLGWSAQFDTLSSQHFSPPFPIIRSTLVIQDFNLNSFLIVILNRKCSASLRVNIMENCISDHESNFCWNNLCSIMPLVNAWIYFSRALSFYELIPDASIMQTNLLSVLWNFKSWWELPYNRDCPQKYHEEPSMVHRSFELDSLILFIFNNFSFIDFTYLELNKTSRFKLNNLKALKVTSS